MRRKFNSLFVGFLNNKLKQDINFNCELQTVSNWIKSPQSRKIESAFWTGTFKCSVKPCPKKFKSFILKENCAVINVLFDNYSQHQRIIPKVFIRARAREELKLKILADGVRNTHNNLIIEKSN